MKGTFRGHLKTMIEKLYLWTTQIKPERFEEAIKDKICFSYDSMSFIPIQNSIDWDGNSVLYELTIDFGDIVEKYTITFTKSKGTNRWVFSRIE